MSFFETSSNIAHVEANLASTSSMEDASMEAGASSATNPSLRLNPLLKSHVPN